MRTGTPAEEFLALHHGDAPLLMPNPWDAGSARLLASLGFRALATTSSGFAATLGRLDGSVTRDEALAHAAAVVAAVDVPVSADLEHGFADAPDEVAETVRLASATGLAGCSIEDSTGRKDDPLYDFGLAVDRVAAAAEAAHGTDGRLVLTARAEGVLYGERDLEPIIQRLQAYQEAGADVLFAPGVIQLDEVRRVVEAVGLPVNVLVLPGAPPVAELAAVGVRRISVGGAFAWAALSAVVDAATELRDRGTYGYWDRVAGARSTVRTALG
jgi:2-methylisocitrate lyase-like PEP mutase family enzyme